MTVLRSTVGRAVVGLAVVAILGTARAAETQAPAALDPAIVHEVRREIAALDAADFPARRAAAERLQRWVDRDELAGCLAAEFARALLSPESSIEVRTLLDELSRQLPSVSSPAGELKTLAGQIIPLADQLDSNSSADRDSAERRLKAMLVHAELVCPVMIEAKHRLADVGLSTESRRCLEPLLDDARRAWLLDDSANMILPIVSPDQTARWIDELVKPDPLENGDRLRRAFAQRELTDLVVRDDTRADVLRRLEERLAAIEDTAASARMQAVVDLAKPGMAAEVWVAQAQRTLQYLTVGVPQFNDVNQRATHFDRIDDQTAHCVTGNSLSEGDYPVGIAIPHPDPSQEMMFHLVNLPTPRRRLAYEYQSQRDETDRLREISERTLTDILAQKRVLTETQILMLAQLEPHTVSRFVGPYFTSVANQPLFTTTNQLARQITLHGGICSIMARIGTHEAVPSLEQLARAGQLGKLTYENEYSMAWVAALAIAGRDPWPQIDHWLARQIEVDTALVARVDAPPEVGASAAAMLLDRHGLSTRAFGLETAADAAVVELIRFTPYRFSSPKNREDVQRWWERQQKSDAAANLAP